MSETGAQLIQHWLRDHGVSYQATPGTPGWDQWRDLADRIDARLAAVEAERDDLQRHRIAVEESFKEYQHRAQREYARLTAQLRAYTESVVTGPHQWRAVQDADPVPWPTAESLAHLLQERDQLQAAHSRRRCQDGHEQDPFWSACLCCQQGQQIDDLRARLAAVDAALARYGRHDESCLISSAYPCICGFDATKAER